ncbi:MAG TPA: hypothetical protein DCL35_07105 [Candidatus Omnitrophica bacterium]|nr:hypothetical protein [Candidatus Omnitrophota bacterium]
MDAFLGSVTITEKEYKDIAELVYKRSGINLGDSKKDLVKARLLSRMRRYSFSSFGEYYAYVVHKAHYDELIEFINAISTNVTSFFREEPHFSFLKEVAFPDIIKRKNAARDRKFRIWSAACSSGEEVYSILIVLAEFLKDPLMWNVKVLGTDISTKALGRARAAVYEAEKLKKVPLDLTNKYFDQVLRDGVPCYRVKDSLKNQIILGRLNLMDDVFPFSSKPDIIFCRNVMIYFDKETQKALVKKFYNCMADGGYFFTGHSESLLGINVGFKNVAPAVYRK